jgi:hypothetical protein
LDVTPASVTKNGIIMARIVKPLTNTEVKNAKAKEKEFNLSDGEGLSLRVKPNGSKNWIFNYTHPISNKRANIGFGIYPEVTVNVPRGWDNLCMVCS